MIDLGPSTFLVAWAASGSAASVRGALDRVRQDTEELTEPVIPLVAVPYMGEVGRSLCEEAGVGWVDLSGNARISAPGLRVHVEGRPNRFKRRGRPANLFAAKSSRIARWLLIHRGETVPQRELARATGMDEGFTSRIVRKLKEDGLAVREGSGAIAVRDPDLLLDAWRETYSFSKHSILHGHIAARSGEALLQRLAESLSSLGIEHAATGLGAAWLLTRFAAFRTTTFYLREPPRAELLRELAFREEPRGANVWLVVPVAFRQMSFNHRLCRRRQGGEKATERRGYPQTCLCPILKRVVGRTQRSRGLAGDDSDNHVGPRSVVLRRRQDNGWPALHARDARKIHHHHITGIEGHQTRSSSSG